MSQIFVKGLPTTMPVDEVKSFLRSKFETCVDVRVPLDVGSSTKKCVAFVTFRNHDEASAALKLPPVDIGSNQLSWRLCSARESPQSKGQPLLDSPTATGPSSDQPQVATSTPSSAPRPAVAVTPKKKEESVAHRPLVTLPVALAALDASCCIAKRGALDSLMEGSMRRLVHAIASCDVEAVHRLPDLSVVLLNRRDAVPKALGALKELGVFFECLAPTFDALFLPVANIDDDAIGRLKRERDDPVPLSLGEALSAVGDALAGRNGWEGAFVDSAGNLVALRRPSYASNV